MICDFQIWINPIYFCAILGTLYIYLIINFLGIILDQYLYRSPPLSAVLPSMFSVTYSQPRSKINGKL